MRVMLASLLSLVLIGCAAGPASSPLVSESPAVATAGTAAVPATASPTSTPAPATASPSSSADAAATVALIAEMDQAVSVQASARRLDTWNGAQGAIIFDQVTEALYQRPDRRQAVTTNKTAGTVMTVIEIGPTRYVQSKGGGPWQVTQPNPPYKGQITIIASFDLPPLTSGTLVRSVCPKGSCFVLTGAYDLPPGGRHTVTLMIDEPTRLPVQMTTKNTYGDGTSYTVVALFSDWGTPMNIQPPKV